MLTPTSYVPPNVTGFMAVDAWRFWAIKPGNTLASPVTGTTLTKDGIHTARCEHHPALPAEGCDCGIGYWTKQDMQQAIEKLSMTRNRFAVTVGTAHGTILPDEFPPRWAVRAVGGFRTPVVVLPKAHRCSSYRVAAILTPIPGPFPYGVPVVHGAVLDLLAGVL